MEVIRRARDLISGTAIEQAASVGLVCINSLISVCMFIVSMAFLKSNATVLVCARGAIWLNPFATVLFNVCTSVTIECCVLYPCCVGVFCMFAVM